MHRTTKAHPPRAPLAASATGPHCSTRKLALTTRHTTHVRAVKLACCAAPARRGAQVKHLEYGAAWDRTSTVKFTVDGRGRSLFQRFVVDVVSMTTGRIGEVVPALHVSDLLDKYGWAGVDLVVSDMEGGWTRARTWTRTGRAHGMHARTCAI